MGLPNLGRSAGDFVSTIFGQGDYVVRNNSIMTRSNGVPEFKRSQDGSVIVCKSEFITDVRSSIAFNNTVLDITPTNKLMFPLLSNIASCYEEYEFLGLVFTYVPTSGSAIASTNNALGTVVLATSYDVSRPLFVSKTDAESYEFATSCAPNAGMYHPIECNPKLDILNSRYMSGPFRSAPVTSIYRYDKDDNLSILGRLQLIVQGMQADQITVGELHVSYEIRLSKPRALQPGLLNPFAAASSGVSQTTYNRTNGQSILGGSSFTLSSSTFAGNNFTVSKTLGKLILGGLPDSTGVKITLYMNSMAGGAITAPTITLSGLTAFGPFYTDEAGATGSIVGGAATNAFVACYAYTTNVGTANSNSPPSWDPGNLTVGGGDSCRVGLMVEAMSFTASSIPSTFPVTSQLEDLSAEVSSLRNRIERGVLLVEDEEKKIDPPGVVVVSPGEVGVTNSVFYRKGCGVVSRS